MRPGLLLNPSTFDVAWLTELSKAWSQANCTHFEGAMRPPVLCLSEGHKRLGSWRREYRSLSLSRNLLMECSWGEVLEVMRHEMAHQYVDEVLLFHGESAHGPVFQKVCRDRAIDGRAMGSPATTDGVEAPRILRKVRALLALADSPNRHEAEVAMRTAHRLMRRYNVARVSRGEGGYAFVQLGTPTGRVPAHHRILAGILREHFFVQPIWVYAYDTKRCKGGRVVELCGRPENLEIATHVHSFLLETGERCWQAHRLKHVTKSNRGRRAFLQGLMSGFADKLDAAAREETDTGLVWVGDGHLDIYFDRRYPRTVSSRRFTMSATDDWYAGQDVGKNIVLRKAVNARGTGVAGALSG